MSNCEQKCLRKKSLKAQCQKEFRMKTCIKIQFLDNNARKENKMKTVQHQ